MHNVEKKLDELHKLLSSIGGVVCIALTLRVIKKKELKEQRSRIVESLVLLDEILDKLEHKS